MLRKEAQIRPKDMLILVVLGNTQSSQGFRHNVASFHQMMRDMAIASSIGTQLVAWITGSFILAISTSQFLSIDQQRVRTELQQIIAVVLCLRQVEKGGQGRKVGQEIFGVRINGRMPEIQDDLVFELGLMPGNFSKDVPGGSVLSHQFVDCFPCVLADEHGRNGNVLASWSMRREMRRQK